MSQFIGPLDFLSTAFPGLSVTVKRKMLDLNVPFKEETKAKEKKREVGKQLKYNRQNLHTAFLIHPDSVILRNSVNRKFVTLSCKLKPHFTK